MKNNQSGGKLQPQAVDLEQAVLGAAMLQKDALNVVVEILSPQSFYKDAHQKIYAAAIDLNRKGSPVDTLTVVQQLKLKGELDFVGGAYYITQLTDRIASTANIEFHARIIVQKFLARELIRISSETIENAFNDTTDVFDLIDEMDFKFNQIKNMDKGAMDISAESRMRETKQHILNGMKNKGITGVPIGLDPVDIFTGGFQRGDLIVLGGLPGSYKTAIAIAFAHGAQQKGFPVYISEQEMSKVQTGLREVGMVSGINTEQMRRGELSQKELVEIDNAMDEIINRKVYIEHESGISIDKVCSKIKRVVDEFGVEMAIIDYLQLMESGSEQRGATEEQKIAKITRKIKQTAKNLNIPIILLSQFSREASKNLKPTKSMLKGSGAIEADADVVILLWNPYSYDKEMQLEIEGELQSVKDKLCIIFDKHRMGRNGDIWVGVRPYNNTFYELGGAKHQTSTQSDFFSAPLPPLTQNDEF